MMRGTAVVCTDTGGLAEIVVDGETGLRVPPGDEIALARAIERLVSNCDVAETFGAQGRKHVIEEFSQDRCVSRFLTIYSRVIAERARGLRFERPELAH